MRTYFQIIRADGSRVATLFDTEWAARTAARGLWLNNYGIIKVQEGQNAERN